MLFLSEIGFHAWGGANMGGLVQAFPCSGHCAAETPNSPRYISTLIAFDGARACAEPKRCSAARGRCSTAQLFPAPALSPRNASGGFGLSRHCSSKRSPGFWVLAIAWVLAFRPDDGRDDLSRALEELHRAGAGHIRLTRLATRAVAEKAVDVLGGAPDVRLLQLADRVDGNPFHVTELFSGLLEDELVRVEAGHTTLLDTRLPRRVRESMRTRLGHFSVPAQRIAAIAACMDRAFTVAELSAVLESPPPHCWRR